MDFNADITIKQLAGIGKLRAMVSAHNFVQSQNEHFVAFSFKGSRKINKVKIALNSMDTYDMTFYKYKPRSGTIDTVETVEGVYADQLTRIFEDTTGLFLSL